MKQNPKGYVSFVLHAHLPFIHHPESEDYLEEQWLFEAISETYIPLLLNFKKLVDEKVDFRITMSMTPPLLNMLDNELLQERYIKYLLNHFQDVDYLLKISEPSPDFSLILLPENLLFPIQTFLLSPIEELYQTMQYYE